MSGDTSQTATPRTHGALRPVDWHMSSDSPSGIHHVNLSVTDLDVSSAWYEEVLGLTRGWEMDDVEGRGRKTVLLVPDTSLRLVLSLHVSNQGDAFSEFRTGLDHIALTVSGRADLESWADRLDRLGVVHSQVKEGATGWLITFRDPDNIQLELYTETK